MQHAEQRVKSHPDKSHQHYRVIVLYLYLCLACLYIVLSKLLLTSRALQLRREEAQYHLDKKYEPYHGKYYRMTLYQ